MVSVFRKGLILKARSVSNRKVMDDYAEEYVKKYYANKVLWVGGKNV